MTFELALRLVGVGAGPLGSEVEVSELSLLMLLVCSLVSALDKAAETGG